MTTTARPIGQLKNKTTVYCTVCGQSHTRSLKVNVYDRTPETIEKAKSELTAKTKKEYTCRICKTITKDLKNAKK